MSWIMLSVSFFFMTLALLMTLFCFRRSLSYSTQDRLEDASILFACIALFFALFAIDAKADADTEWQAAEHHARMLLIHAATIERETNTRQDAVIHCALLRAQGETCEVTP